MIDSFNRISVNSFFQIFLFTQLNCLYGTVTQSPSGACVGDSITVSCVLTLLNAGDEFVSRRTNFIIGDSNNSITESLVDGSSTVNGIDPSRFMADDPLGSNTNVTGSVTLFPYQTSDEDLRVGCSNEFTPSGGGSSVPFILTLRLNQAHLPSISTPIATIQNFNSSTCEGTLRFNLAATSDRDITSYSILFNGSSIASNLPSSNTEFTHNTQFLLNTNYPTSIIATSCAGNSTDGDASVGGVNGYMQSDVSCAQYNNVTGALTIDWTLNTPSQPTGVSGINIAYSVRVTYSHCNGTVTYSFTDTSNFNLMSFEVTTYDVPLTAHNFANPQGVETNIITYLRILQQCGQDLVGTELSCSLRSVPIPISPTPLVTTNAPTTNLTNPPAAGINPVGYSSLIIGISIIGLLCLIALVVIALLVVIIIFLLLKNKQLNSIIIASKAAPSHPYEYIDLDKMSDNISSPTQQQSPQDYVPMSSVSKQDPTPSTTHYANLK